jgi:hypothetical protein
MPPSSPVSPPALSVLLCLAALASGCADDGAGEAPGGGPAAPASPGGWLVDVTAAAGLASSRPAGPIGDYPIHEIMASGAGLFDADGDGDLDVYLTNVIPDSSAVEGVGSRNRFYRRRPDGTFVDATAESGLAHDGYGVGIAVGDVDNDGDPDVYLTNRGPDRLFVNQGDGSFAAAGPEAGASIDGWSTSAAFLDYDRDGFLDLYVARYVRNDDVKPCADNAGRPDYCSPKAYPALHDVLLHNRGDGSFEDVSERAGMRSALGAGLGVVAEDFNDDGWVDVYVANDDWPNQYWVNRGDGTFRDEAVVKGAAFNMQGRTEAGMGVVGADLDDDLDLDLFMTHLSNETNTFYRNLGGDRGFEDATGGSGLAGSSLPWTGFGTAAIDLELDGDLDLVVVNGRVNRGDPRPQSLVGPPWNVFAEPNLVYLNEGGARFRLAGEETAAFTAPVEISRGLVAGDVDGDGDLDLLVSNMQSGPRLYRNDAPRAGAWLAVRVRDPRLSRDAVGARVTLVAGEWRRTRTVARTYSYQSSAEPVAHFGLGPVARPERIEVRWPDGLLEAFPVPGADVELMLLRGEGEALP